MLRSIVSINAVKIHGSDKTQGMVDDDDMELVHLHFSVVSRLQAHYTNIREDW